MAMPDVLGYRAKFGVLVPSTNTTFWYALRDNGFPDRLPGFGQLLREY